MCKDKINLKMLRAGNDDNWSICESESERLEWKLANGDKYMDYRGNIKQME